ncbi:MAG: methionyl-tRNA formyltransferase, partial [Bacteroidota bacterium]
FNIEFFYQLFMSMRIIFMGSPEFAVAALDRLVNNGFNIVGVITATDKKGGRGNKQLIQTAVKRYALEKGLRILQPKNLKHPEFVAELRSLQADLQVVVAFRMLPEVVWNMPKIGTINLHGSLLPKYRGAAPIHWAVINGEKETGVTTFFLKHEIDTGDMLLTAKMPIGPKETTGSVHDRMMQLGAEVVLQSVQLIQKGDYQLQAQDDSQVSKAPKLNREICQINFDQDSQTVFNFIRGLSPFPVAWTQFNDGELKIFRADFERIPHQVRPGEWISDFKSYLKFATQDGFIEVLELKPQGKRKMDIKDFLNGFHPK